MPSMGNHRRSPKHFSWLGKIFGFICVVLVVVGTVLFVTALAEEGEKLNVAAKECEIVIVEDIYECVRCGDNGRIEMECFKMDVALPSYFDSHEAKDN